MIAIWMPINGIGYALLAFWEFCLGSDDEYVLIDPLFGTYIEF